MGEVSSSLCAVYIVLACVWVQRRTPLVGHVGLFSVAFTGNTGLIGSLYSLTLPIRGYSLMLSCVCGTRTCLYHISRSLLGVYFEYSSC